MHGLESKITIGLVVLITLAFAWTIQPFFGAILWAVVVAILFIPLHRHILETLPNRRNTSALLTLAVIITLVIIPTIFLVSMMVQEAANIYALFRAGKIDIGQYFSEIQNMLPGWAGRILERFGLDNFDAVRDRIADNLGNSAQMLAAQVVNIGQSTFGFIISLGVMLYLTYFLLRDGDDLTKIIDNATPLPPAQRHALFEKFITVVRATIKGSVVVAIVQGLIGGITFWFLGIGGALLWGVAMGIFSLLPAIGTGLVWAPVAIYLFATGQIWQGAVLVGCGALVIGSVDNILRPILVGRDTRMPDYVVLISTLGGLEVFGFNGFVIGPVIAALFMAVWLIFTEQRMGGSGLILPPDTELTETKLKV